VRASAALLLLALLAGTALAQERSLKLSDRDYFERPGLNVLAFSSEYDGMFFDEKTAGVELVHHGVRTATGGAVRLKPTPEQWDQIPRVIERKVDREASSITVLLRYEGLAFDSRLVVRPAALDGRAGLNLELLPSAYFEKTYLVDGKPAIFPLYPLGRSHPPGRLGRERAGHRLGGHELRLWGENEYVIDICAHFILLANMANDLLGRQP
jgi:endoglucanase